MTTEEIEKHFKLLCETPSDINEHLPILREYASKCKHVTEMGVRGCVSTYAFLASECSKLVCIDIMNVETPPVDKLEFKCASTLDIEIEPTDFLFIDTYHVYAQLKAELAKHHSKVDKYIAMHDVSMFGKNGEDGGKGLLQAIREFMTDNPEWKEAYLTNENNGLMILYKSI